MLTASRHLKKVSENTKEYIEALFHSQTDFSQVMDKKMHDASRNVHYETFHIPPDG